MQALALSSVPGFQHVVPKQAQHQAPVDAVSIMVHH